MSLYDVLNVLNQVSSAIQDLGQSVLDFNGTLNATVTTAKGSRRAQAQNDILDKVRAIREGPYGAFIQEFEDAVRLSKNPKLSSNLRNTQLARIAGLTQQAQQVGISPALLQQFRNIIESSLETGRVRAPRSGNRIGATDVTATPADVAAEVQRTTEQQSAKVLIPRFDRIERKLDAIHKGANGVTVSDSLPAHTTANSARNTSLLFYRRLLR